MPNYYDVLGVPKSASEKDVRQAYRKLAREYHPDVNSGDKASEDKFKRINEAYSVLSDKEKRSKYDRYGDNWAQGEQANARGRGGGFRWSSFGGDDVVFDFDPSGGQSSPFDFFSGDRSRGNPGRATRARRPAPAPDQPVEVTLEQAFSGTTLLLELLYGRRLEVKIPPGVDTRSRVRVAAGEGERGTIYLAITVKPHPSFQRQGDDLNTEVEVPLDDAVLGGEATVRGISGNVALSIPAETQNGQRFRLSGQGMPSLTNPGQRGDLYATVKVKLPTGLTVEHKESFEQIRRSRQGGSASGSPSNEPDTESEDFG